MIIALGGNVKMNYGNPVHQVAKRHRLLVHTISNLEQQALLARTCRTRRGKTANRAALGSLLARRIFLQAIEPWLSWRVPGFSKEQHSSDTLGICNQRSICYLTYTSYMFVCSKVLQLLQKSCFHRSAAAINFVLAARQAHQETNSRNQRHYKATTELQFSRLARIFT